MLVILLSVFWLVSGLIGLMQFEAAKQILISRGIGNGFAHSSVLLGSLADIILGAAILWRPLVRRACSGMILLSISFLVGAAAMTPDLWLDPLGSLVKVFPGIGAALAVMAMAEER
jgi:hypothetical protein